MTLLLCCRFDEEPMLLSRAAALCTEQRRQRAERLSGQHRAASLTAGLLLRHGLFLHGLSDPPILIDPKGRPYIEGNSLFFSLSHSGNYAACALATCLVGVDIQKIVPISERVIHRFATKEERQWLAVQPDSQQAAVMLWTLKESYLKASGTSTKAVFETTLLPDKSGRGAEIDGWKFTLYYEIDGYVLALCEKTQGLPGR